MGHCHARPERASLRNRAPFDEISASLGMTRRGQNNKGGQITDEKNKRVKGILLSHQKKLDFYLEKCKIAEFYF